MVWVLKLCHDLDLRQVVAIYEEHNRDKLHTVDDTLDKYEGKWAVMLKVPQDRRLIFSGSLAARLQLPQKYL